ncbi:hypothetical protein [Streptomyces sp. NEAU-174]|uniref:hypothetical protein n=1 Tax=Streptomyces sp. NEAU-174 TaxID=3458254 RepID=UPI0040441453
MTEPMPLTAEQFLPVAVAMARREQQQKDGLTLILAPLPNCPACARSAVEVHASETRFPDDTLSLLFRPCGHRFTVAADMGYEVARLAEEIATREEREGGDLLAEYIPPAGEKVSIGQPEPPVFVIALHSDDGTLIVGIRPDGSIQQGPNYQPDAAAAEFWDAVTRAAHSAAPWTEQASG